MKGYRKNFIAPAIIFVLLIVFTIVVNVLDKGNVFDKGDPEPAKFTIPSYRADFVVHEDRIIDVKETITINFTQRQHGIIRDFPMDDGIRYSNIRATRGGETVPTKYRMDSVSLLSLAVGDEDHYLDTYTDYVYTFEYTMHVTTSGDVLSLDVLGFDWQAKIGSVHITLTLPDEPKAHGVQSGIAGVQWNERDVCYVENGNEVTLTAEGFGMGGITLDLKFESGVFHGGADLTPLWAVLILLGVAVVFIVMKLFIARAPVITRTVNLTAPDAMDPLLMGKLIDDRADPEDMGALVFWFAGEGYLTIDLTEDEKDPLLIKTEKPIPSDMPRHLRTFYEGLFATRDRVRVSQLENTFYTTTDSVKASVTVRAGQGYETKGKAAVGFLAILAILLFGGFVLLYNLVAVGGGYIYFMQLIVCAFAFVIPALLSYSAQRLRFKWKKRQRILLLCGAFLAGCLPMIMAYFLPSAALPFAGRLILTVGAAALGTLSGFLFVFTEKRAEQLGQILGFKDFILYTERDKIEFMLKENPELYYKILPYAQVLGVTNAWTEKFKGLDMPAPSYARVSSGRTFMHAAIWHSTFHSMNSHMGSRMVSRPTNSGGGHGHGWGGGHFGGGGHGHGGGGGRSF